MRIYYYLFACIGWIWVMGSCNLNSKALSEGKEEIACREITQILSPIQLKAMMEEKIPLILIEVSPEKEFLTGHIGGAQQIWRTDYTDHSYAFGGMRAPEEKMANLLRKKGVGEKDVIILYDRKGNVDASRVKWVLEFYGANNVYLLNGGIQNWLKYGYSITKDTHEIMEGNFTFSKNNGGLRVISSEDVLHAIEDTSYQIIDTRTSEEFSGLMQKNGSFRAGRIPGSIHFDWMETVDPEQNHIFRNCREIDSMLSMRGISSQKKIITYCHSGVRSAHMAFVLTEIMGFTEVWNYDGSWIEWSFYEELPIEGGLVSL